MQRLLSNIRFRHLFVAQVVALTGTGLTTVALGLLAYDLAGERATIVLGSALAIKMVAYVLVSPMVGAIADRVPRQTIMLTANLVRGGVVLALPLVSQIWHIFVLIAILQAASATFTPVFQSALVDIVPDDEDYARALSASQLASSLETVLSPLLAAAALAVVTYNSLFVGTSLGFAIAAILVAVTRVPEVQERAGGGFATRLFVGIRLFRATPQLRGLLALNLVVASTGAISLVTTTNVVLDLLGGGESDVGLLLAVAGAGTASAALTAPWMGRRLAERSMMLVGAGISSVAVLAALVVALAPSWASATVAWALIGFGPGWITVNAGRVLRRSGASVHRPALFSAQFSLSHACWLITYPLTGWLAADAGFGSAWSVLAVAAIGATFAAAMMWPVSGGDEIRHRHSDGTDDKHVSDAQQSRHGWTHSHRVRVDENHPQGPVPA